MEEHMEKVGEMEMINCSIDSLEICRCKELEERSVKAEARCAELELELQKKMKYCEALEAKLDSLEKVKNAMDNNLKSLSISAEVDVIDSDDEPNISGEVNIIDTDDDPNTTQQPVLDNQDSGNISFSTCDVEAEEQLSSNSLKGSFCGGNNEDLNSGADVQFTAICKRKRARNVVTSESENDDGDDDDGGGDDHVPISQLKRMQFLKVSPKQVRCDLNELVTVTSPMDDQATGNVTRRRRLRKCVIKSQQDKKDSRGPVEGKNELSIPMNKETNNDELEEVSSDNEKGSLCNFIVHDSDVSDYEDTSSKSQEASDGEAESDSRGVSDGQEDKKFSCEPSDDRREQSIPTNKDTDDDESEQVSSDNEEGSLCNFIDHDSDVSEGTSRKSHDASDGEAESDSQDVPDEDLKLKEILSQIQRKKDLKRKWEFEGDMLAAFGKDAQLCMKAVCTLYRQQTSEEQMMKESKQYNGRGFSNVDAFRGSTLAEFLTGGDPLGDVKKSVKELEEYDARGVETCRTMALRYSKQLFEIYNNKDPLFP